MRKLRLSGKASRLVSQASEITNPVFNASLDSKHRLQLFFIDHVIFSEGSSVYSSVERKKRAT